MRLFSYILVFSILLLSSCAKYSEKKVEGVWLLEHINLCVNGDCFDTLEDRGTRAQYDKIELRLTKERDASARFYKTGVLLHSLDFEFIFDDSKGRISFLGPEDIALQFFFGTHVEIVNLKKNELVYQVIEDYPDEETVFIFKRLQ